MAGNTRKRSSSSGGRKSSSSNRKSTNTSSRSTARKSAATAEERALYHEIWLIVLFVAMLLLFLCNFGLIGPVGNKISGFLFGLFGVTAYAAPVLLFLAMAFWFANEGNPSALRKLLSGISLFLIAGVVFELFSGQLETMDGYDARLLYQLCSEGKSGGGIIGGSVCYFLHHYLETVGTLLVVFLCTVISVILLTERSMIDILKERGERVRELNEERKELAKIKAEEFEETRTRREAERACKEEQRQQREEERRTKAEERRRKEEEAENEKILRREKNVKGVMQNPTVSGTTTGKGKDGEKRHDVHEIQYEGDYEDENESQSAEGAVVEGRSSLTFETNNSEEARVKAMERLSQHMVKNIGLVDEEPEPEIVAPVMETKPPVEEVHRERIRVHKDGVVDGKPEVTAPVQAEKPAQTAKELPVANKPKTDMEKELSKSEKKIPKKYVFPPVALLTKGVANVTDSTAELRDTAARLQQTLNTFGVKVTITDISQGPSVTRYELQPEQGVKVSKIVGLADDIKLNLAATDIRIEAPIPGKAAIGIEVPNKENSAVAFRDLIETAEFRDFKSNIAFAVGKDIGGKTVVTDIGKMPHMLIAGATGSGKSVCINTLIMSILYKAHPDDVKLIMVDPKVVELSVYNGIPHLLIPVVTDPKKASAALHWGVSEMEDRYRKFADFNVRDLKGYNEKVLAMQNAGDENAPKKLPQIIIIVDELADLMMVSPGEVEESICRLAQLARAAGIHLIIATQRPSVDVITGLIKANMPSRVAFSVSSGVDSRTILDMNGAEKLLGKGDMLFYPQGYTKPARIQGAFVSDKEVSDVVDFLKNQTIGNVYSEDVVEKLKNMGNGGGAGGSSGGDGGSSLDPLFEKAGRFIIEKDKASIGMLQRVLSVGFNRAARIMDQLCEYGVVGEEEGTKPRKILMSPEQFEQLIEEVL